MYVFENEALKSHIKGRIRNFFDAKGFTEVDTPLLSPTFIPEHTISLFKTLKTGEFTPSTSLYLLPSPELYMKRLLSLYKRPIYQISKAFRNAEQRSAIHDNEFTMLEFYIPNADYNDTLSLTAELIKSIFASAKDESLLKEPIIKTVSELLKSTTGFSLAEIHDRKALDSISSKFSLNLPHNESFDDTFNRIFVHIVEPAIAKCKPPVFVKDYPVEIMCLAKAKNELERERFELYHNGIELANGYSEMHNKKEIKALLDSEKAFFIAQEGLDNQISEYTLQNSSGVAIGLDRLIMVAEKIDDIKSLNYSQSSSSISSS